MVISQLGSWRTRHFEELLRRIHHIFGNDAGAFACPFNNPRDCGGGRSESERPLATGRTGLPFTSESSRRVEDRLEFCDINL